MLDLIGIAPFGQMIVRSRDPAPTSTTLTTTSSFGNRSSYRGQSSSSDQSFSKSQTFDTTPPPPIQTLRVFNASIYDIKDLTIECGYLGRSGTPLATTTQKFFEIFGTGRKANVDFEPPLAPPGAVDLGCAPRDFEYVGVGEPPPPPDPSPRILARDPSVPWISDVHTEPGVRITDGFGRPLKRLDY
ncbi:hypothetical protein [Bradyrhizobium sp. URHD0069]|uniref:hypothetical protein n=1 Tax=Bradyrhizobium sp. URHD0069 TaxID=1380355 RepID=UPI0012DC2835|nr:hypothetical protein [Bradyrhizobium sp. URHD0069]